MQVDDVLIVRVMCVCIIRKLDNTTGRICMNDDRPCGRVQERRPELRQLPELAVERQQLARAEIAAVGDTDLESEKQ